MSLIVQKFGGSSVADLTKVQRVAKRVTETYDAGNKVVVVVSAQGDTTDDLIAMAKQYNPNPSKREMDMLLSTGEIVSASLLAMTIGGMGYPVVSLSGQQAGFLTTSTHGMARIRKIDTERLENELDHGNIVIVAGFQGMSRYDNVTTLGRGGSDTTAVALAASLHANLCQIFTDVDGVYTADPRKVPGAEKLHEISFDEMLELATMGAQVLHNRSVEMAKKYNVKLEVLSSITGHPGTIVKDGRKMEKMLIRGVAKDTNVVRVTLDGVDNRPGVAYRLFALLAKDKINVDIILQTPEVDGKQSITFTISEDHKDDAVRLMEENMELLGAEAVNVEEDVAKVSIVGAGMETNPGVAAKMFEALADADINIKLIATSEIKISVIINESDADKAVNAIHEAFFG